jgi:hypothetical protein
LRDVECLQCSAKAIRELDCVVIRPEVDEERAWVVANHVIVDRRHLDPVVTKRRDERIELARKGDEISGDRRLAAPPQRLPLGV